MTINTHQGVNIDGDWIIYRNSINAFRTVLTGLDTSAIVFSMEFYSQGGSVAKLTLTEASGAITNDDAGTIDYSLSVANLATLPRDRYFFVIKYTTGGDTYPLAQGYTNITSETNPGTTITSVTIPVNVNSTQINMTVTMGGVTSSSIATALGSQSANIVYAGPSSGSAAAPAFRALADADIPAAMARLTSVMGKATSVIYPDGNSFKAFQNLVGPDTNDKAIEIVNIGYTGHGATDDIHQNTTGLVRINGRIDLVRNMAWDSVNEKWLTPLQAADGYGSSCLEIGGEAVILHATPSGVNFSDVPHEILLASANGTDGPSAEKVTSGYFVQIKAPLFARFDSAAYDASSTANTWNDTAGTHPLVWLSTGEAKGTETELLRLEGNLATPGFYFKRSNGTLASRSIASANASAGKIAWAFYDGGDFETTAQIDGISDASVASNDMGGNIRFMTSASNTAGLTERMKIRSDGNITMSSLPTSDPAIAGALWNSTGTLKISAG